MTRTFKQEFVAVMMVLVATSSLSGQDKRETVLEAAARGATGRIRTAPSGAAPSLASVLSETELVVRGLVGKGRSYISDDGLDVYTDYDIANPVILYEQRMHEATVPGAPRHVVVTQLGGSVALNGTAFTQTEDGLAPLREGSEGLFLLNNVNGKYHIAKTFFGAFVIKNGVVAPLTRVESFVNEYHGLSADDFTRVVITGLAQSKKAGR